VLGRVLLACFAVRGPRWVAMAVSDVGLILVRYRVTYYTLILPSHYQRDLTGVAPLVTVDIASLLLACAVFRVSGQRLPCGFLDSRRLFSRFPPRKPTTINRLPTTSTIVFTAAPIHDITPCYCCNCYCGNVRLFEADNKKDLRWLDWTRLLRGSKGCASHDDDIATGIFCSYKRRCDRGTGLLEDLRQNIRGSERCWTAG